MQCKDKNESNSILPSDKFGPFPSVFPLLVATFIAKTHDRGSSGNFAISGNTKCSAPYCKRFVAAGEKIKAQIKKRAITSPSSWLFYPSTSMVWRYGGNGHPGSRRQPN